MNLSTLRFLLRETHLAFQRGRLRAWLSVITLTVTLTVLGGFLLLSHNLTLGIESVRQESKIVLYLSELPEEEADPAAYYERIERRIREDVGENLDDLEFVSKNEAMERLAAKVGAGNPLLAAVEGNPLPASFEIRLKEIPNQMGPLADRLGAVAGVNEVAYGREALESLFRIAAVLRSSILFIGLILTFFTVIIVANTIKLTVYARQTQIEIMKLVGSTDGLIRAPFLLEGALQGFFAACASLLLLRLVYELLVWQIAGLPLYLDFLPSPTMLGLFLLGIAVGVLGVLVSVGEFLKPRKE